MTSFSAALSSIAVADYPVTYLFGVKDGAPDSYGKVPMTDVLKKDASGNFIIGGLGIAVGATNSVTWMSGGTAFNTGGGSIAFRGKANGFNNGGLEFYTGTGATGTEAMRIDDLQHVFIGSATSWTGTGEQFAVKGSGINTISAWATGASGSAFLGRSDNTALPLMSLYYNGTFVGSITTNGTSVAFNTTSDYRLKSDLQPLTGAWDRIKDITVYDHAWTNRAGRSHSVIAHELAAIVPDAVRGAKDAMRTEVRVVTAAVPAQMDATGAVITPEVKAITETVQVPDYQGVDYSKLVPDLIAALQEAQTRIEALEAALAA